MIARHLCKTCFNERLHTTYLHVEATHELHQAGCVSILCEIGLYNGAAQHMLVIQRTYCLEDTH